MNFNTANSTFRQLMGNGMSYRVPLFQRDYSWGGDEWDDLWQDLVALFGEDPEPAHYMGYLVLQSADTRAFDIIDGQQRMTTLSLLMLAAVAHLTDLAVPADPADPQRRRAEQLRSNYIGYLDPVSLVPRSKLTLNRHNDRFYQNYLVPLESLPQRGLNASEHLLRRAFLWFRERIKDRSGDDGESVARFVDVAVDKLFFTIITVTDELNAFKVFETLNACGVRLSATDLLKNYLFSVVSRDNAHESDINNAERDRAGFGRFLQAIAVVSFRYNVICGRQSNEQEVVYNQIARELAAGEIVSAKAAIARLRPVYPEDAEFRAAFADKALRTTSSRNNKVVRFILFRLEAQLSGQHFEFESAKHGIEHVLPENPRDDWHQFDDQQREASTYCLGNMTLLRTADNRDLGTSGYAEKRLVYQQSDFAITRKLAEDFDTWTVEKIRSHQTWMARQATGIWRVSF